MYINPDKKKKVFKKYKLFNIDIHGKLLKKRKLQNTFYQVYLKILKKMLYLNTTKKNDLINALRIENIKEHIYINNPGKNIDYFNDSEFKFITKIQNINYKSKQSKYVTTKDDESLIFDNRLKKYRKRQTLYFKMHFARRKVFFNLYMFVTKNQYLYYLKKAGANKQFVCNSFFNIIESRIDMLIYRSFSNLSLQLIKQMILHRKIYLNNKKISYNSVLVKKDDYVSFMNTDNFENYDVFIKMYLYMLAQRSNLDNLSFLYKYPKYVLVDYNFLWITLVSNTFECTEVPNFFEYNLKEFIKIVF